MTTNAHDSAPRGKRSRNLKLVLMAVAAPAVLAGCDDDPSGKILTSREECTVQTEISREECEKAYGQALVEHEKVAPRFESQQECNQQFGACTPLQGQQANASQPYYIPPMTGFLLGYAASQLMSGGNRYYHIGGVSPLYRDYQGGRYLKPDGKQISTHSGTVYGRKAGDTALPARAVTVSRAGFGSSAAARGGFGRSSSSSSSSRSFGRGG
ncbi:DUF1190 domain-containing protein [Lysobacter enzymogenes]|uniref:DUF1190 domain-containing protein n=1 Tax=Lysobacter enzymogenes TaxID=69 RepID=UPI001AF03D18|nr:DUF1190 domain-containing protein [Lysobacter enzymogenes]QQQ01330.1 DUF1190 domain-containing protein [Lysobacter enzymogenes]